METLELEPLEGKKLKVYLVAKEFEEEWSFQTKNRSPLKRFSREYCGFIKEMVEKHKPDFVTEELGMRSEQEYVENSHLAKYLGMDVNPVDMPAEAKGYIESSVNFKVETLDKIKTNLKVVQDMDPDRIDDAWTQNLLAWGNYLEEEIRKEEEYIGTSVRSAWMAKGILDLARKVEKKDVTCIHICSTGLFDGLTGLFNQFKVKVEQIKIERKIIPDPKLTGLLKPLKIEIKPVSVAPSGREHILYVFDTDEMVSPFDINMAIDAGFDAVMPYSGIGPENASWLIQDMIFSRGVEGVKYTAVFLGGRNIEMVESVLKVINKSMVPPFQVSVVVDPRGAFTTAAAIVAKIESALQKLNLGKISDKKVAVLGGTGPVGQTAAAMLARIGCDTTIVETDPSKDQKWTEEKVRRIADARGVELKAFHACKKSDICKVVKNADIILSAAKAGIQILPRGIVEELKPVKILVDINAAPPAGIEGIKPGDDAKEMAPGIYSIGPLAIGSVKNKVETKLLKKAMWTTKGIYDYIAALETARDILDVKIPAIVRNEKAETIV